MFKRNISRTRCKRCLAVSTFFLSMIAMLCPPASVEANDDIPEAYRHLMPIGDDFPGTVPAEAERVTKTVKFSLHPRDFSELKLFFPPKNQQSTGLYRVPGESITVEVHPLSETHKRPQLRIGAHTGGLVNAPKPLKRVSYASDLMNLDKPEQEDRNWASGLIYLESDQTGEEAFEVTIKGAVRAPWFKLGRDTPAQWKTIRQYPAPWAELEGEHTILTLPSAMIRDLVNPIPVIKAYDQLVKDANALAGLTPDAEDIRHRAPDLPFRFVLDCQTNHDKQSYAGYNVVFYWLQYFDARNTRFLRAKATPYDFIDPETIRNGYIARHELGHNYEPEDRVPLLGSGQGIADVFLYAFRYRLGHRGIELKNGWSGDFYIYSGFPGQLYFFLLKGWTEAFKTNPYWKEGSFLMQLINEHSPEAITHFYKKYRTMEPEFKGNDRFLIELSEASGYNLAPLFSDWGIPFSPEAQQQVFGQYPCWHHDAF